MTASKSEGKMTYLLQKLNYIFVKSQKDQYKLLFFFFLCVIF